MPLKRTASERELQPLQEQEEEEPEAKAKRPRLEPVEALAVEQGPSGAAPAPERQQRPYQDFVESEVRKFWQEETGHAGSPAQQIQQKVQAPAIPVHDQPSQTITDDKEYPDPVMAHHAVGAMIQHALEAGWIKPPFSEACESPNYVEALIQLAYEANWLAMEIPLPDHPAPKHPTIYYTIDSKSKRPVPRKDSLIRGDYVYTR